MRRLQQIAEAVRRGEPLPPHWRAILTAATPLTRLGMRWRLSGPRERVDARVVSFGNITAGGTGKTPAVVERARMEVAAGRRVAVLTRGYGSGGRRDLWAVDSTTASGPELAEFVGDEPALILRRVPEVRVIKGADRVSAARLAIERFGCDTLILDDGFQYVRLERDENIALIDATNPFGNGRVLPRGILREPPSALARATHIILTRCDQAGELAPLLERLAELAPGVPIRRTRHAPVGLWRVADDAPLSLEEIRGQTIDAACAIGHPEAFFATLEGLGARLIERHAFPDHRRFDPAALSHARPVVVTEKDAVRLADPPDNVYALSVDLQDVE